MAISGGRRDIARGAAGFGSSLSRERRRVRGLRDRRGGDRAASFGKTIDRLVRQRAIDAGLDIEGQQLAQAERGFVRDVGGAAWRQS